MNIKYGIDKEVAKAIFGNIKNAKKYLEILAQKDREEVKIRTKELIKGKNKGKYKLDVPDCEIWDTIINTWIYDRSKTIIRDMYQQTKKYKDGKKSFEKYNSLIEDWKRNNLGVICWPHTAMGYDASVQRINNSRLTHNEKDNKASYNAIRYRRIKEINTARNDYIEYIIFENNEDLIPTLKHKRGLDFYINGEKYDQKVSKSPTKQFKEDHGDQWKQEAKKNPSLVAQYLYQYQDAQRFNADKRLLVVSIDEDVKLEQLRNFKLDTPHKINFFYKPNNKKYENIECFVILLTND